VARPAPAGQPAGRGNQLHRPPARARGDQEEARRGAPRQPRWARRGGQDEAGAEGRDGGRTPLAGRRLVGRAGRTARSGARRQRRHRSSRPPWSGYGGPAGAPSRPPQGQGGPARRGQLRTRAWRESNPLPCGPEPCC